jgi:hypothetical protein
MPVRITCPHCLEPMRLPEELYEGPVQCPRCKGGIALGWHPRGLTRYSTPRPEAAPVRKCRFCGVELKEAAERCPGCGEHLGG